VVDLDAPGFISLLRERTSDITTARPKGKYDLVFVGVKTPGDLKRIATAKAWIEFNGAVWAVRPKGKASPIRDTDLIDAGLAAGLVDNKIASFSDTQGAMRFVYRLKDRPR
jgi:hypothetical protein